MLGLTFLYSLRQPEKGLFGDEASSHLDRDNERIIKRYPAAVEYHENHGGALARNAGDGRQGVGGSLKTENTVFRLPLFYQV